MTTAILQLNKNADRRLRQGHRWIYSNEVDVKKTPLKAFEAGEQAILQCASGKTIGRVVMSPQSLICARLIARDAEQELNASLLVHRLKIALSLREGTFATPHYRLIYGDSDGLPGLVIDRFGDDFVVQISSAAMEALKADIVAALEKVCRAKTVLFRNDGKMRQSEGLDSYLEFGLGEAREMQLEENGVKFVVPVYEGQKTGWFYDHRLNRARLKDYVKGKRVLDLYSYIGGWGVQLAAFGAESVTCVDRSSLALDYLQRNAELNGVAERVQCIEGDVFEVCRQLKHEDARFDLVIVDPPAFIPRRKDQKSGEQAYHRLNHLAMRLLAKDGLLLSASCSMHLPQEKLVDILRHTARSLEKELTVLEQGSQGPDHPILPAIPETQYLKSLLCRVLPAL
ncbi:MAG: class I SAM-dependent rRNA methyltransferase [Oleiphilaceae bacterium]|nr:class I SAM-dependent rRNA methyltransferase [Oleiphilaceae bacterium]